MPIVSPFQWDSAFSFCRTYLECLNVRARLLVLQREGAMASVAEQQQLKKEQLLASLGQLLAGQSPDIQAAAILAVGNLNVLTCATLMEREEDVRRAAVMQLVQQATAPAAAAADSPYAPQSWQKFMDGVHDWSEKMAAKSIIYGPARPADHSLVKKVA
ncbi:hypothetical protein OEZ86_005073 [Tetradesmus obliquus]|nr:hypothetical protein OEZ86_005073 [Tetradesmus obliquus]